MEMVGVDSGSLYRWIHSLSRLAWSLVGGTWRHSTFIKWTGWYLSMALPWWQHYRHCLWIIMIIIIVMAALCFILVSVCYWSYCCIYFCWLFVISPTCICLQENMPYFRRRMIYEIVTKRLLWGTAAARLLAIKGFIKLSCQDFIMEWLSRLREL